MIVTFWRNLLDPAGEEAEIGWGPLFERLSRHDEFHGDREHPGWSPARFEPCQRAKENVREVHALTLDFDNGTTLPELQARFGEYFGLVQSTRKYTPQAPRWRVVLPFTRSVSGFEFAELWRRITAWVGDVDPQTKDASRFWFLPGTATNSATVAHRLGGSKRVDPDEWLAKPAPSATPALDADRGKRPIGDTERRARAYVSRMPAAISGQQGHRATWAAALACKGFGLTVSQTLSVLREYNLRCEPPWSEKELEHKATSAINKGRVPDGFKLESDWEPSHTSGAQWEPDEWHPPESGEYESEGPAEREPGDDTEQIESEAKAPELPIHSLRKVFVEVWESVKTGQAQRGFTTTFEDIDALMCGLRKGHVTVLAAGTSWGKSTATVAIADENLMKGARVLVVSAEDSRDMYGRRFIARRMRLNAMALRDNALGAADIDRLGVAAVRTSDDPVFLDAIGKSGEWISKAIKHLVREEGFELVLVDYIQRIRAARANQDRRNEVTYVTGLISDAIKESGAAGLLASQLKRIEGREPTLEDVKESGDVENMAEHVLLGYRVKAGRPHYEGEPTPWERKIKLAKNKDGPVLDHWFVCKFNEITASFEVTRSEEKPKRNDQWNGFADEERY